MCIVHTLNSFVSSHVLELPCSSWVPHLLSYVLLNACQFHAATHGAL